jgi:hypothetical protein
MHPELAQLVGQPACGAWYVGGDNESRLLQQITEVSRDWSVSRGGIYKETSNEDLPIHILYSRVCT